MTDLREELRTFMDHNYLSQRRCAGAIGISTGTLSEWLSGTYIGNTQRIEDSVRDFLERQRELQEAPRKGMEFAMTSVARKVFEVARICHLDREIGVCYGAAGLGKTEAVREYARKNPDVILVEVDLGHTAKALFSELHRMLNMDGFGTVHNMFGEIVEKLRGSDSLIIVDEAEHLPYRALELLRRIHDKAGIGIMLVGMPRLLSNLRGRKGEYAQLYSRVGIAARLEGLRPEDTRMIVEAIIPTANGLSRAFHDASTANTRTLSKLIARSMRVAELNDTPLSPQVIKETSRMLII